MEEGKLKLTDPVAKYLPEFKNSKVALETVRGAVPMSDQSSAGDRYYLVPANHDITIIDLLTHTSGLSTGGIANADLQSLLKSRKPTDTLADFIPRLGPFRSISSPARNGATAAWPGSTPWAALSR